MESVDEKESVVKKESAEGKKSLKTEISKADCLKIKDMNGKEADFSTCQRASMVI